MVIIWGTTQAGKVDEVPGGMFHVVTQFGHLYYIPLIPTGSFVVLEKTADGGFRGAPIPLSFKSLLAGWLRAASTIALVISCVVLPFLFTKDAAPFAWTLPFVVGCLSGALLLLTYKLKFFTQASYERAKELAQHMQLNDMGLLMLDVTYGRLTAAQAEAELARREAKLQEPVEAQVIDSPAGFFPQ